MEKATVRDLRGLEGTRVFLRADLNVPLDKEQNIMDETRIVSSLDTLKFLIDRGARIVMASHLGRPRVTQSGDRDPKFSLLPVFNRLVELLPDIKIIMASDCIGEEVEKQVKSLKNGQVLLLENVRYYKEETANDLEFAKSLASYADYFVNDAFGTAHRAHASTAGIAGFIPGVAGLLVEKELKILGEAISAPKKPLTVIMGGKKVEDKMGAIDKLLDVADNILIGGGMSYTFVWANGGEVGDSITDSSALEYCRGIRKIAKEKGVNLLIAPDCIAGDEFSQTAHVKVVKSNEIPDGWAGYDIGPQTIAEFRKVIAQSGTIFWNGPLGVSEFELFRGGTRELLKAVTESNAVTIIGGGDTAAAAVAMGFAEKITHISTGGGASLEFVEGKKLPGVEVLMKRAGV